MCTGSAPPPPPPPAPPPPPPLKTADRVQPAQASRRAGSTVKRKRGTTQLTRPSMSGGSMAGAGLNLPR